MEVLRPHHRPFDGPFSSTQADDRYRNYQYNYNCIPLNADLSHLARQFTAPAQIDPRPNSGRNFQGIQDRYRPPSHIRRRAPPHALWEQHRSKIIDLYRMRRLHEVRKIMKQRYNFDAT
jgi:Clr5 domain